MKLRKVGIGLGCAGILATTLSLSGNSVGAAPEGRLRVIAVSTEQGFSGDEASPAVGDIYAFSGDLYAFRRGDHMGTATKRESIGRFGVSCTLTSVEEGESLCSAAVEIDRRRGDEGQITVQGLVTDSGDDDDDAAATGRERDRGFDIAITGGTDDFENAGGTLTVFDVSETVEILSFSFAD